jgi:hypothetical protein
MGGGARAVLHRKAMHGQRPPSKAMQQAMQVALVSVKPCEACVSLLGARTPRFLVPTLAR